MAIKKTLRGTWDEDSRMEAVSTQGKFLWLTGAKYASRYGSSGFVPDSMIVKCVGGVGPYRYANELCQAGLWQKARGGYRMVTESVYASDNAAEMRGECYRKAVGGAK